MEYLGRDLITVKFSSKNIEKQKSYRFFPKNISSKKYFKGGGGGHLYSEHPVASEV